MSKPLLATFALLAGVSAQAAIGVATPAFSYSQNFDTLASTGTANAFANDVTIPGWSAFSSINGAVTAYIADAGTSTTGGVHSYGAASSSERALGSLASNAAGGASIAVAFTNQNLSSLSGFTFAYDGEQWRNGGNTAAVTQTLTVDYGFGSSYATVAAWTAAPAATFTSPVTGASGAAVDGNTAGRAAGLGATVSTGWAAGETLWLRWTDVNDTGNDHGLAIDNVSFSVSAVPEPGTWTLLLAGLGSVAWVARRRG